MGNLLRPSWHLFHNFIIGLVVYKVIVLLVWWASGLYYSTKDALFLCSSRAHLGCFAQGEKRDEGGIGKHSALRLAEPHWEVTSIFCSIYAKYLVYFLFNMIIRPNSTHVFGHWWCLATVDFCQRTNLMWYFSQRWVVINELIVWNGKYDACVLSVSNRLGVDTEPVSVEMWTMLLCSETNLKVRQALPCTADMIEIDQLSRFDG